MTLEGGGGGGMGYPSGRHGSSVQSSRAACSGGRSGRRVFGSRDLSRALLCGERPAPPPGGGGGRGPKRLCGRETGLQPAPYHHQPPERPVLQQWPAFTVADSASLDSSGRLPR